MRKSFVTSALVVLGLVLLSRNCFAAGDAAVLPVRIDRPVLVGASLTWPWVRSHDVTIPLPTLHLGVNLSPHLAVEVTGGWIPFGETGRLSMIDVGVRWLVMTDALAPYLLARAGDYWNNADEGGDRSYPFAAVGAGLDYSAAWGGAAWLELGPALFSYSDGISSAIAVGFYASVGVGYRL